MLDIDQAQVPTTCIESEHRKEIEMSDRVTINGFSAKVLRESKSLHLVGAHTSRTVSVHPACRVTQKVIRQAVNAAGFDVDWVTVTHYRYCTYMLRLVMSQRSGSYNVSTTYRRRADGSWFASDRSVRNEMY